MEIPPVCAVPLGYGPYKAFAVLEAYGKSATRPRLRWLIG